jgi:hypothetical protein
MAAAKFHVEVHGDVAVLVQEGAPLFDETTKALAAVIATSLEIGSKKIIIDTRLSDLVNYYNFVVRHAELLPAIGLDGSFRSAIVGLPEQVPVMDFSRRQSRLDRAALRGPGGSQAMAAQLNSGTTVEVPSPPRVQRSPGLAPARCGNRELVEAAGIDVRTHPHATRRR